MLGSTLQFPRGALGSLALLTGLLVATACARGTATREPEPAPEPEPQQSAVDALAAGDSATVEPDPSARDLTASEVKRRPHEKIEDLLEARTPGVQVSVYADGSLAIRIRGVSSFLANSAPLIVVDGTPVRLDRAGRLRGISPHDIETITVLKDPTDTALYGVRGANGVILITTVRPMP
jgi:TonB-dependent SusC/RagA subfamily outer membrane receptor